MDDRVLTPKMIQSEYGFGRKKVDEILSYCNLAPRVPGGRKYVLQSEFEKALKGQGSLKRQ